MTQWQFNYKHVTSGGCFKNEIYCEVRCQCLNLVSGHRTLFTVLAGRYRALVHTTQRVKIALSWCLSLRYRALVFFTSHFQALPDIAVSRRL